MPVLCVYVLLLLTILRDLRLTLAALAFQLRLLHAGEKDRPRSNPPPSRAARGPSRSAHAPRPPPRSCVGAARLPIVTSPAYAKWRLYRALWWTALLFAAAAGGVELLVVATHAKAQCAGWVGQAARQFVEACVFCTLAWRLRGSKRAAHPT